MKKAIVSLFCIIVLIIQATIANAQCPGNLIQNSSFSNGLTNWQTFSGFLPNPILNVQACLDTYMVLRAYNTNTMVPPQDGDGMYQPAVIDSGKCYNLCACMSPELTNPSSFNNVQFWAATNDPTIDYTSLYNNTYAPDSAQLIGIIPVNVPNPAQQYCINGWFATNNFSRLIIFNSTDSAVSQVYIDNICFVQSPTCAVCDTSGLTASFVASGNGPNIQFTNTSTTTSGNIIGYEWNFNDVPNAPNDTSTQQNPFYVFSSPGTYFVCLKVYADVNGFTCVDSICMDLIVTDPVFDCDTNGINNNFTFIVSNDTAFFTSLSGIATGWSWDFDDPASAPNNISTLQNPFHAFSSASNYNACLIISFPGTTGTVCYDTVCNQVPIVITNIAENYSTHKLKIHPNPTNNIFNVEGAIGSTIHIYDLNGKLIRSEVLVNDNIAIDVSTLSKGVYMLKYVMENYSAKPVRIVKL